MTVGSSAIPNTGFLRELQDDARRNGFVADHLRMRIALLIRALREQRGWSQAELGRRLGKPQSVVSRLEDPDYGKVTLSTLFEVAEAFDLPLYIDMPNWDDWFRLMSDMSNRNLERTSFDFSRLVALAEQQKAVRHIPQSQSPSNPPFTGFALLAHPGRLPFVGAETAFVLVGGTADPAVHITAGVAASSTMTVNLGLPAATPVIASDGSPVEMLATASGVENVR